MRSSCAVDGADHTDALASGLLCRALQEHVEVGETALPAELMLGPRLRDGHRTEDALSGGYGGEGEQALVTLPRS